MLCLLTGESIEPLSHAPFEAKRLFGETLSAAKLALSGLRPDAEVYLPPCIAAFVGADTTCAIVATRLCEGGKALLADIGTNGERIGLLPSGTAEKTKAVGNAALSGAAMLLLAPHLKAECEKRAKTAKVLALSANKCFSDRYIERMFYSRECSIKNCKRIESHKRMTHRSSCIAFVPP